MDNTFGPEGIIDRFEPACLAVEVAEIIVHKADQPNLIAHLFDADALASEDDAEIDLLAIEADSATRGDGSVVEWNSRVLAGLGKGCRIYSPIY
jgi:hypothetical protein